MPVTDADREGYPYKLGVAEQEIKQLREALTRLERENRSLEHHYKCHREAGERLHTQYHEIRDALREAVDVWASHLNCMPNVRSRKRLDEIRTQFGFDVDADE